MDLQALFLTIKLALFVTPFLIVLVLPAAYFLSFSDFRGKSFIEAFLNLPLFIPPTVLGFFLLMAMGQNLSSVQGLRL